MRMIAWVLAGAMLLASTGAWGQSLQQLVDSGAVRLESVRGNGSSTGTALEGTLVNTTARALKIDIDISPAMFFKNRGAGQNMFVRQVLGPKGEY